MEEKSVVEELSSYLLRFRKLCADENALRKDVLECNLNLSLDGFRSILWMRWLGILSQHSEKWPDDIEKCRSRYDDLRAVHLIDDRRNNHNLDPSFNNPLSQDTESPWNQFFIDSELKKVIEKDVVRTSMDEVRSPKQVKELMQRILFVYGKEHTDLQYKQGMHEILSSILFVVMDDISACQNVVRAGAAQSTTFNLIQVLLCPDKIENDVYSIFEKIMEFMWDWYGSSTVPTSENRSVPFSNHDEVLNNSTRRLQNMWVNILQLHEKKLFDHLQNLQILPTTFGINWTKLLFTRQFTDYCKLWDAVMVSKFSLVDYIVVAMVVAIKSKLILGDSNTCNMHLVSQYPNNVNPRYVIQLALYLQDTKKFVRPKINPFISDMSDGGIDSAQEDLKYVRVVENSLKNTGLANRSKSNESNNGEAALWHFERLVNQLAQMEIALDSANCNDQLVRQSLRQVKETVNALGDQLPKPKWSQRHKRNASIAMDALAFE